MSNVPCPNVACSNKKLKRGDVDQFGYDGFSCLKCGGEYSFPYSIGYFDGASDLEATRELFREAVKLIESAETQYITYEPNRWSDFLNKPEIKALRGER